MTKRKSLGRTVKTARGLEEGKPFGTNEHPPQPSFRRTKETKDHSGKHPGPGIIHNPK